MSIANYVKRKERICTLIKDRQNKLWQEINRIRNDISAFLITNPKNIYYISGFTGEGILISSPDKNFLITDSRYTEQANEQVSNCQIIIQDMLKTDAQTEMLCNVIGELKINGLGFEAESLSVDKYLKYQSRLPHLKLYPLHAVIEKLRIIKDDYEIELLKKSAHIATSSFLNTISLIKHGISELTIAAQLNYNMQKNGAKKEAFDIIVTSGERGLLIHGEPSVKRITKEELIIIDFGCIFKMYNSDCTRSLLLGEPNSEQKKIFEIIKNVQIATLQQVRAGKSCYELDDFARKYISKSGYGDYFLHSLGHGIGLDVHELPRLSQNDQNILQPGMVVTIEPGIYVPGIGGVRIEDTVIVTENGCEVITLLPKELSVYNYQDNDIDDIVI